MPGRNLFFMLSIAFELPDPLLGTPTDVDSIEEVLAFVVAQFVGMVEERIDRGLYRAYVEEEDNLAMVRGRTAIVEDVRHNHVMRHRTYCRYSEYSWDVPENQVIRQVVRLLVGWRFPLVLRRRLRALDVALEEVTPGRYVAADLDRFAYNRLNEEYRPLHALCRLFLAGASPSDETGPFPFEAFLLDMNRLFEAFVTQVLRDHAPTALSVHAQSSVALDTAGAVPMRPDVVIRRAGSNVLVADCKYKRLASGEHRHHDLYQLLAYCTALDVSRGVLIYPQHVAPIDQQLAVHNTGVTLSEVAIDLGGDPDALGAACGALARPTLLAGGDRHGDGLAGSNSARIALA